MILGGWEYHYKTRGKPIYFNPYILTYTDIQYTDTNICSNQYIAKRKREEEKPQVHCEDEWDEELYSNSSNYVIWNKYGNGEVASFGLLPDSKALHGQNTVSNMGGILKKEKKKFV